MSARPARRHVALGQAAFYLPTTLWPLVSRRTFEAVTGRKAEWWLVQNVALLAGAVGLSLGVAGARRQVADEVMLAGAGTAAAFTAIDVVYLHRRRLRWTYGLDAGAQIAILTGWAIARRD